MPGQGRALSVSCVRPLTREMRAEVPLKLTVQPQPGHVLLITQILDGCVLDVRVGDRILSINGKYGINWMMEELRNGGPVHLEVYCHRRE